MPNDPIFGSGNRQDPWQIRATELINWLYYNKQAILVEGSNITLTPRQDGTVEISASGGGEGTVTDVLVDGQSVVNQAGEAEIIMPSVPTDLEDLDNVNPISPADGQALIYDENNQKWINGNVSGSVDDVMMNGQSIVSNKVASFQSYIELTQSEYDALPVSKLTDGILYCIKDTGIVEGEKFAPVIYSLEEREVGVWHDGKPIYEKVFIINGTSSSISNNILSDLNISVLISGYYLVYESNNMYQQFLSYNTQTKLIGNKPSSNYWVYRIVVRYTKTTDVPGSGKWGTDGVPMVHYDDTERIIGTWFGETLYQKTIVRNNLDWGNVHGVNSSTAHNITNIGNVVGLKMSCPVLGVASGDIIHNGNTGDAMASFRVNSTDVYCVGGTGFYSGRAERYWYITLQYTKTTD